MRYCVTFVHYGAAIVEANSAEEAFAKVDGYGQEDISWNDDFEAISAQEEKEPAGN